MLISSVRVKQKAILRAVFDGGTAFSHNACLQPLNRDNGIFGNSLFEKFSTISSLPKKLRRKVLSRSILLGKLEGALKEHQVEEAWETFRNFKCLYGYPDQFLVANLITELSYSSDSKCLHRACDLVHLISKEKSVLLGPEVIAKPALSLVRAQVLVPASNILRLMLAKRSLPSLDVLRLVFLHLVKTEVGTHLASNILEEICSSYLKLNVNKSAQQELTKPDATIFNLVLEACVRFRAPLKGQQLMELMPQIGVTADAHTVVIIARLHEMNGMRDELKKFKDFVDKVPATLFYHYQQFYDHLLSLHFKFDNIDDASSLLVDLCKLCESKFQEGRQTEEQKPFTVSIGPDNIKMGLKLQFLPLQLQKDFVYKADNKQEFLFYKNGKFALTDRGLAELIIGYQKSGRSNELSKVLISIKNMLISAQNSSPCSDVIEACIYLGWLETAHDILEDFVAEKYSVGEGSYISLLTAYYNKKMLREAEGLLRQIKRFGLTINISDISKSEDEEKSTFDCKSALANSILEIMRKEDKPVSFLVHEYNASIYFFTKAKMSEDAMQTYRKMQEMKIEPNASTFFHLVRGCCSLGMYREITILWGDIKRSMAYQKTVYDRDLYELLLLNFIRGGYFERVMEVVGIMKENGMFLDKRSYKTEFLKLHRDLYRNLTAIDAKDATQSRRIEFVKAFRKMVGIG